MVPGERTGQVELDELEAQLWESANILRGPIDQADFKSYVFPLLFLRSDERRARLAELYGNAMETTGHNKPKQTAAQSRADGPDLQVTRDAA